MRVATCANEVKRNWRYFYLVKCFSLHQNNMQIVQIIIGYKNIVEYNIKA